MAGISIRLKHARTGDQLPGSLVSQQADDLAAAGCSADLTAAGCPADLSAPSCPDFSVPSCPDLSAPSCPGLTGCPDLVEAYRKKYALKYWVRERVTEVLTGQELKLHISKAEQLMILVKEVMKTIDLDGDLVGGQELLVWRYATKYVCQAASCSRPKVL